MWTIYLRHMNLYFHVQQGAFVILFLVVRLLATIARDRQFLIEDIQDFLGHESRRPIKYVRPSIGKLYTAPHFTFLYCSPLIETFCVGVIKIVTIFCRHLRLVLS